MTNMELQELLQQFPGDMPLSDLPIYFRVKEGERRYLGTNSAEKFQLEKRDEFTKIKDAGKARFVEYRPPYRNDRTVRLFSDTFDNLTGPMSSNYSSTTIVGIWMSD